MKARVIVAACAVAAAPAAPAQAAIALRAAASANTGTNPLGTLTIPAPAGLAVDDVMVATIGIRVIGNTVSAPAGWSPAGGITGADTAIRQTTFWKVATAADVSAGSFTFNLGGTLTRGAGGIVAYSGADTAAPLDVSATNTSAAAGTTGTASAVTTTYLRSRVIVAASWQGGVTITPDAATAERYTVASTNLTASNNATTEVADVTQTTPGSAGPFTLTSSASGRWVAQTIALNEMPALTASFPSAYAWPALVPGATATSSEQTVSVTSNRSWGVQIASDRSDGLSRQWNGSAYGSLALASPLQWRTSTINGTAQATSFAGLSGTAATAATGQAASASAVPVGITFRQPVSYADEAALPAGNTYRQNVSYTAQQGF